MSDTKEKHTPGPWVAYLSQKDVNRHIACKDGNSIAKEVHHANARLIAAAPEMYEQCKLFERSIVELVKRARNCAYAEQTVSDLEELGIDKEKLREVLAKVDGGEG